MHSLQRVQGHVEPGGHRLWCFATVESNMLPGFQPMIVPILNRRGVMTGHINY
jgi:hypothetical protein